MITKICLICGNSFETSYERKKLCSKECYKDWNRIQAKERYRATSKKVFSDEKCPDFICSHCRKRMTLDFNPRVEFGKWKNFLCPFCGTKRTLKVGICPY